MTMKRLASAKKIVIAAQIQTPILLLVIRVPTV
jgi:hypothetical protein